MGKGQHSKSFHQRQLDRQLDREKRRMSRTKKKLQHPKEQKGNFSLMKDNSRELQELTESLALAEMEARNYKNAWNAEKKINRAKQIQIVDLQACIKKEYDRGFKIGSLITLTCSIIGFLIGLFILRGFFQ